MNATIKDFVEVEEISKPMSESEYVQFLARMGEKRYSNDAIRGEDGIIDANDQVLAGLKILVENEVGI
jgi:hypothetical protein